MTYKPMLSNVHAGLGILYLTQLVTSLLPSRPKNLAQRHVVLWKKLWTKNPQQFVTVACSDVLCLHVALPSYFSDEDT